MRYALLPVVFAGALACTRDPPRRALSRRAVPTASAPIHGDAALSASFAAEIASAFIREGVPSTTQDNVVRAAGHTIVARADIDQVVEEPDHATAVLDVTLQIDDETSDVFRTAAIGIDANRSEAIQHAVREWAVGYAIPIVQAIHATQPALPTGSAPGVAATLRLGPFAVYPGPTGVRGEIPASWDRGSRAMHQALFAQFEPALDELIPVARRGGFHTFKITLHVRNGTAGEGECRVDGIADERLCQLARQYPWPSGSEEYLFKQFYVLTPHPG